MDTFDLDTKFFELGLTQNDRSNAVYDYSWQNSHASRIDVARFVHGQPYWRSTKPIEEVKKKKLLLNSYLFLPPVEQNEWNLLTFLFAKGFEIYTRVSPYEIAKLSPNTTGNFQMQLCSTQNIQNELLNKGEDINEYVIIDDKKQLEILKQLKPYVKTYSPKPIRSDQLWLTRQGLLFDLTDENINSILAVAKQYKTIHFILNNCELIWDNHFSEKELIELFNYLRASSEPSTTLLNQRFSSKLRKVMLGNVDSPCIFETYYLKSLQELKLQNCPHLTEILGLGDLTKLRKLSFENVSIPTDLPSLPNIKKLKIKGKMSDVDLQKILANLPNLESLELRDCEGVVKLDLTQHSHLKHLKIIRSGWDSLQEFIGLDKIPLEAFSYDGEASIIDFKQMPHLKVLKIDSSSDNKFLYKPQNLEACQDLEEIYLKDIPLHDVGTASFSFTHFKKLKKFEAIDVPILNDLVDIDSCLNLEHVKLRNILIKSLDVSKNTKLETLKIENCQNLSSLTGLEKCPNLNTTRIVSCEKLPTNLNHPKISPSQHSSKPTGIPLKNPLNSHLNFIVFSSQDPIPGIPTLPLDDSNRSKPLAFDTKTYTDPNEEQPVLKKFINPKDRFDDPSVSSYREILFGGLSIDDNDEIFLEPINPFDNLVPYTLPATEDPTKSTYLGVTNTRLLPNEKIVLSGLTAQETLVDISDFDKLELFHNPKTQQYIVNIKPGAHLSTTSLRFLVQKDAKYREGFNVKNINTDDCPKLPPKLRAALATYFHNNPQNAFVQQLMNASSDSERLSIILRYCYDFKNKAFKHEPKNDVNGLIKVIQKARGSCRHRSMAAMALGHYFGIPVRINMNGCHAFIEIPKGIKNIKWRGIDLGGARRNLKVADHYSLNGEFISSKPKIATNKNFNTTRPNSLPKTSPAVPQQPTATASNANPAQQAQTTNNTPPPLPDYHAFFWDERAWIYEVKNLDEYNQNIIKNEKPSLIRIGQKQDAWRWHVALNKTLSTDAQPYVYIDNAEELKTSFETVKIDNGEEKTVAGPTKKIIEKGQGTYLINWSNFDPTERVIYKSMLDDPPTLNSLLIPAPIHFIGMLPKNMDANDVFLSRSDEFPVPNHLGRPQEIIFPENDWLTKERPVEENKILVNLYHSADWAKLLVEEIRVENDHLISKPGPLITAMKYGLPIIIQNAPFSDPTFDRFWHQLTTENKFLVNGEEITHVPGFKVYLETKKQVTVPEFVKVDKIKNNEGKHFYINQETFNHLFEIQQIDKEHRIKNKKNWLQKYKSGDQFIVEDNLTEDQWQRIYDALKEMEFDDKNPIHFYFEPDKIAAVTSLFNFDDFLKDPKYFTENVIVESKDIHFTASVLKERLKLAKENIFYLGNENPWSTLIEKIELYRDNDKIRAKEQPLSLFKKLQDGETVILCGDLKPSEFRALKTLFYEPPFLLVNGKMHTLPGKLILISNPNNYVKTVPKYQYFPNFSDYKKQLEKDIPAFDKNICNQIENFLNCCSHLSTNNPKYRNPADYNYQKIKDIYNYIAKNPNQQNPIKSILSYHYRKDSEHYAFLNVMAKIHFSKESRQSVDVKKFTKLRKQIKSDDDKQYYFWRMLNCFSTAEIKRLLPSLSLAFQGSSADGVPKLSEQLQKECFKAFTFVFSFSGLKKGDRYEKQLKRLKSAIKDPEKPFIYLLGESGTGKTYTAKLVAKELGIKKLCVGEDDIKRWLTHPEEGNLLLLDEINLATPGKWEFLRGLKTGVVYYDGQNYPITTQKIIATGNGLHYNLRNFHPVIWDLADIIWFGPFQSKFIEKQIKNYLKPILGTLTNGQISTISALIIKSYKYLRNSKEHAAEISLRDIENICTRFISAKKHRQGNFSLHDHIMQAIYDEMSGIFFDAKGQSAFKEFLINSHGSWRPPEPHRLPTPNLAVVPPSKTDIWRLIEDDLLLRDLRIAKGNNFLGKLGTLIEGPSGIGKSTYYLAILKQHGFRTNATDTQKKYVQITAGSLNDEKELLEAFHNGSIVIIDELNASPKLENLLNQLLTGVDFNNNPAKKPGFMVLASQNPPRYAGVKVSSRAIMNRLHKITMDDYSDSDLEYIATAYKISDPKKFTQDFIDERRKHPFMNARNFFRGIKRYLDSVKDSATAEIEEEPESFVNYFVDESVDTSTDKPDTPFIDHYASDTIARLKDNLDTHIIENYADEPIVRLADKLDTHIIENYVTPVIKQPAANIVTQPVNSQNVKPYLGSNSFFKNSSPFTFFSSKGFFTKSIDEEIKTPMPVTLRIN